MAEPQAAQAGAKTHPVTLIPGDWVGPETCEVVRRVIDAAGVRIDWDVQPWRGADIHPDLLASCRRTGAVLKAKLDAKRAPGRLPPTIQLRKALQTWATVRPVTALAGIPARFPSMDVVVIRETSEDIYSGLEHVVADGVFEAVKVTTEAACERIARFAYHYVKAWGRKKVTIVHKANIMKRSDGLFLRTAQRVAAEHPDIQTEEVIVDALCMRLVRDPSKFDVLLAGNLFGDIVSGLCTGLAGGITASPSVSVGDGVAIFDNPHGKAPELTGTGRANPIPMLMTGLLLLEHLEEHEAGARISRAIEGALKDGLRTYDRGGTAGCAEVSDAVVARL